MHHANQSDSYRNAMDGANVAPVFHKKSERINWKTLATVDINRIVQHNDIRVLRDNIKHVAFCDIEAELDVRDSDRNLVKIFQLAQLMVDYLLSSQDYLAGALNAADERGQLLIEEADSAKRKLQQNEAYISDLKRECHRRKKLILAQQQIMDSGPNAYHRCPYCEKAFLNGSFLQAHLEKRHADRYIKDWHLMESGRKRSPKRDHGDDQQTGARDHQLELLLQKLLDQRVASPGAHRHSDDELRRMAGEFDRERNDWQNAMRQLQNEIEQLHGRLGRAHSRNKKHRSHLKDLEDDMDNLTKEDIERARQKAIDAHRKKPIIIADNIAVDDRLKKPRKRPDEVRTEAFVTTDSNAADQHALSHSRGASHKHDKHHTSPPRQPISPRHTASSPVHRHSTIEKDRALAAAAPTRESVHRSLNNMSLDNLDNLNVEFPQVSIDKVCDQVRHMLDDHLELHGIPRGTTGISGAVLQDKLKLLNHEQSQLKAKYVNYAEIRKRIEAEVDQEARNRLQSGGIHERTPQRRLSPDNRKVGDRVRPQLSGRSLQSSQSEWDDESQHGHTLKASSPAKGPIRQPPMQLSLDNDNREKVIQPQKHRNTSPERSPDRKNNLHVSSDMSNTIDSSAWQTESKAVTSVANASHPHKPTLTNRSSDYGDESDFSI